MNGSSSLIKYKQTTVYPILQASIKPPSVTISTIKTGLHAHQVTEHHASNISVANSSVARMVQVSHGSTQSSHRSTYATYHQVLTTLIEASTNVNTAHTDTKYETLLWSPRMTNNSSIPTLQTSTASGQALVATRDNFTAHFTLTVISVKKDTSIKQISLPLLTQTHSSSLAASKSESSNAVTVSSFSSISVLLTESSSSLNYELFSRTAISPTVSTDISAMNSTTMTSQMVIFNRTYRVASKTSVTPQNSLTGGGNSNLFSHREGSATTAVNHTLRTLPTKTATSTAWSSSSSSLSSTSTLSYTTVVIDKSSFQTTSRSVTGRRTSDNQDRQTVNILIQRSSSIMFDSTVSLKPASLIRMSSRSSKLLFSQSISLGSNTLESMLEDRSNSEIHVTIATTDEPVEVSKTKTTRDDFTSGMRFRTTMVLGSLTKTILPSSHSKRSDASFSVTSMVAQTSTFLRPNGESGSLDVSSLPGSESLQTYPRTVALSMPATTSTPKPELSTSYNMSTWLETIILTQTSKMSTDFSGISVSNITTGTSTFSTSIKEATVQINSSDMRTTDSILDSSLDTFAFGTNSNMKSAVLQTSDGVSTYPLTQSLTAELLFSIKGSSTSTSLTTSTAGSGSRLQFQTLAHSSSSLPFSVSPGVSVLTTQKPPRVVSVTMQDKSSTHASIITVPSPSTDGTLSSATGLLSISNIKEQRPSSVLSSTLSTLTDTLPWKTSTPQITYDDSKGSTTETFSRANASLYSIHSSLRLVSTSGTTKSMVSNSSLNTNQLSTTALLHSTHVFTSKSVNRTQGLRLTSVPSSLRSRPVGYVTRTRDTTSASASLRNNITDEITVESSVFAASSHATIPTEQPFGSVSTNTLSSSPIWTSSKTKETLDSIQIQSSPSQETSSFTSRTSPNISPDTTEHFATATTALVATVGVPTPTELPTASPKQFDVSIVLRMTWKPNYEFSYTLEFQVLASKIKTLVTAVLKIIDGFLSLIVLRFWKGSVGVDFVVFVNKNAEVSENTLEGTIIEANNTGALDLPLTSIQVQERETTTIPPSTQSTNKDKSIERWVIILIVAGILVFLMLLIISCLLVSEL